MSSAGINPLAIIAPDLYAKQLAIQRRQALAQSLLESGGGSAGSAAYGGLANAGKELLGAFLAKRGDQDMANLYSPQPDPSQAPPQPQAVAPVQPSPQVTNTPPNGSPAPQGPLSTQSVPEPQISNNPGSGLTPQALGQALQGKPMPQVANAPRTIPQAMNGAVPDLLGMSHQQSMLMYFQQPQAYFTALAATNAPTPDQKNANAAFGAGTPAAQQALQGVVNKQGSVEVRPEGYIRLPDGKIVYGPNESSNVYYTTGPNNEPIAHMIPGGAEAAAKTAGIIKSAQEGATIFPSVETSTGAKVPMTGAQALGGMSQSPQLPLGIRSNNPGNLQPGGVESQFQSPQEGISAMSANLDSPLYRGKNTVSQIVSTWAPPRDQAGKPINDTAGYIADVSARMGVKPNQTIDLSDPGVKGLLMHSMMQHENGMQPYSQGGGSPQNSPQIGESTAQKEVNEATGTAATGNAHAQAVTQSTLKAIDGLIALNDQVPDSTGMSPDWKADINKRLPEVFKGDAGALAQWNQLNGIGVLGGLKQLQGLGRLDLPEVNQVVKTNGVPADVPRAARLQILQNLKTMIMNNLGTQQNTVANLNQPGIIANTQNAPMQNFGKPSAQDIVNELRRRGAVK